MRKKDTLYTVNKWNKPAFMPEENLFYGGGDVWQQLAYKKDPVGYATMASQGFNPGEVYSKTKNWLGVTKAANPFSKGNLKLAGNNIVSGLAGGVGTLVGNTVGGAIAGDYELGGVDTVASTLQSLNTGHPALDVVKNAVVGTLSGIAKRGFGIATDEKKLGNVNSSIAQNNSFVSNSSSNDAIQGRQAVSTDTNVYSDGWFTSSAGDKNKELAQRLADSISWVDRSIENNISNVTRNNINNQLANYSAYGGPIDAINSGMGAIDYGFMSDYLTMKKKQAQDKNKMGNMFAGLPSGMFAFGGDMQTNSADYSTGLTHIDAGGSHEESPYDGVQMGVDQNGVPNLVEEGEVVFNDYVYSARIEVPDEAKKWLGVRGKDLTFADAAKQLEKEVKERPNDPVSRAGLKAQMEKLEEEQEFVKRCTSYSVGEVYDVENNEMSLLNHNGYEYEKLG